MTLLQILTLIGFNFIFYLYFINLVLLYLIVLKLHGLNNYL
jgi:hypothetical protein